MKQEINNSNKPARTIKTTPCLPTLPIYINMYFFLLLFHNFIFLCYLFRYNYHKYILLLIKWLSF